MRLPYADPNSLSSPEDQETLQKIKARRGPRGLLPLDLALLHSPPVADGWNSFLGAIRTKTSLPPHILELAICRPALLNSAWFEWRAHAPLLAATDPFTSNPRKLDTVAELNPTGPGELDEREWVVLRYADAMTRDVSVDQRLFDEVKGLFDEREVVELTAVVAAYNTVSRFLVALDVGEQNGKRPEMEARVVNAAETDGRIQS